MVSTKQVKPPRPMVPSFSAPEAKPKEGAKPRKHTVGVMTFDPKAQKR